MAGLFVFYIFRLLFAFLFPVSVIFLFLFVFFVISGFLFNNTFKPSKGISVSRIKALSDDLALNLAADHVRIEAPIPGRPLMELEVPNRTKAMVSLKEVLQSKQLKERRSNMLLPFGRDVSGDVRLDDLEKMPHLLVAGATGSGKTSRLGRYALYQFQPA